MSNILPLKKLSTLPISNGVFNDPKKVGKGCKLVNVVNLYDDPYINPEKLKLLDVSVSEFEKFKLQTGDLIFTRSSLKLQGIAHCNMFISKDINAVFECHTMRIRPNPKIVFPNYLYYFCRSVIAKRYFMKQAQTTTMTTIGQSGIGNLPVPLPPLPEQKAIADLLSTWDTAIEKTEALITAKQQQFDWLVNELINNSDENWSLSALENISKIRKGKQKNRDTLEKSGGYPVWNGGITPSGYTDQHNAVENTITISEGGNSCGFVNFCKEEFWLGGHCYALEEIISKISPTFLFFLLKGQERYIMSLRIGSGLPNIQMKSIKKIEIKYPNLQKQKRIAKILNTAKQEIDSLKSLTKQYRTQKRGLMQKLLTGK